MRQIRKINLFRYILQEQIFYAFSLKKSLFNTTAMKKQESYQK